MVIRLAAAFDENAGTTAALHIGTGLFILSTSGKWVPGANGSAVGTLAGGAVYLAGTPALNTSEWSQFTCMADINPDAGEGQRFLVTAESADGNWFGIQRTAAGNLGGWISDDDSLDSSTPLPTGVYSKGTVTWDGTTVRVYLGTTVVHSAPFAGPLPDITRIDLTRADWSANGGSVDNLRIADHAMSLAEIEELIGVGVGDEPGPPEPTPLATPEVDTDDFVDPTTISGTDGEVTVSWEEVVNSASYDAMIANGSTPTQEDFTLHEADVTSPYKFEGQGAGTRAYGIIARAPEAE